LPFIPARRSAVVGRGHVESACQVENLYALEYAQDRFGLERQFFTDQISAMRRF